MAQAPAPSRELRYKVVELSTVDEGALERTLNEWIGKGWNLDGVQFAMRESSKRPAMAFVFFTREAEATVEERAPDHAGPARERLRQLAGLPRDEDPAAGPSPVPASESSARTAVELAAAALFDVSPTEAAAVEPGPPDEENGALRWVELPEESDE